MQAHTCMAQTQHAIMDAMHHMWLYLDEQLVLLDLVLIWTSFTWSSLTRSSLTWSSLTGSSLTGSSLAWSLCSSPPSHLPPLPTSFLVLLDLVHLDLDPLLFPTIPPPFAPYVVCTSPPHNKAINHSTNTPLADPAAIGLSRTPCTHTYQWHACQLACRAGRSILHIIDQLIDYSAKIAPPQRRLRLTDKLW